MSPTDSSYRLNFPSTLRNRDDIAGVLSQYLPNDGVLLEIASGSGEHGVYFQELFPQIIWQTSDPDMTHRKSINSWISHKGLDSIMPESLNLDVEKSPWPLSNEIRSLIIGIVCINMIHISPFSCTKVLFEESRRLLNKNHFLMLYGPFLTDGIQIPESNLKFDKALRSKNPLWGVRYLDRVNEIAFNNGFRSDKIIEMPANNLSLIYRLD